LEATPRQLEELFSKRRDDIAEAALRRGLDPEDRRADRWLGASGQLAKTAESLEESRVRWRQEMELYGWSPERLTTLLDRDEIAVLRAEREAASALPVAPVRRAEPGFVLPSAVDRSEHPLAAWVTRAGRRVVRDRQADKRAAEWRADHPDVVDWVSENSAVNSFAASLDGHLRRMGMLTAAQTAAVERSLDDDCGRHRRPVMVPER
jgi:hypothetical protein